MAQLRPVRTMLEAHEMDSFCYPTRMLLGATLSMSLVSDQTNHEPMLIAMRLGKPVEEVRSQMRSSHAVPALGVIWLAMCAKRALTCVGARDILLARIAKPTQHLFSPWARGKPW